MLVSLDDMKTHLGIPLIDTTQDVYLTEQLNTISMAVENYCGRKFESTSYTQTFYGDDYQTEYKEYLLYLYHFPTISLTSVIDTGDLLDAANYRIQTTSSTLYRIENSTKVNWFPSAATELVVVYTAGYATIPYDIQLVVKNLIEENYTKHTNNVGASFGNDVQRISIPGVMSLDFDYSLQANERKIAFGMILGNYANVLDFYRSERTVVGEIKDTYVS